MRRWLLFLILFFPACAPSLKHYDRVEEKLRSHRYEDADQIVEKSQKVYGSRNILLYYLDRGMLLHLAGRYQESNTFFEKAKTAIERLYTESLLSHAGALISNDNLLPYDGEDFEKVLVHLFSALNYAALEQWDEALVEARQVDARLIRFNDKYDQKNVYQNDAFARYLSGVLYETRDEINDALISYRKSFEAFQDYKKDYQTPVPSRLGFDLLKMSDALHLEEEFEGYQKIFPKAASQFPLPKKKTLEGEVVVVAYAGRSPVKEDAFLNTLIPNGEGGTYLLTVAFPKFVARSSDVAYVEASLAKEGARLSLKLDLVEDITAIAKKNLEDRITRITLKTIARATAKYHATRKVRREIAPDKNDPLGQLIGLLGNVYSVATEQSDKRSWLTLPGKIYLGRLALSEGKWDAEVRFFSPSGALLETRRLPGLSVVAGKKRFLLVHTAR